MNDLKSSPRSPGSNQFNLVDRVTISIADPEIILARSSGEVTSDGIVNNKTRKPAEDGLFCEKIFGPIACRRLFSWESNWDQAQWECSCRACVGIENQGKTCEYCGTKVSIPKLRRENWGHIELAEPVSHIWLLKNQPSPIRQTLDRTVAEIESVIRFEKYIVIDPGKTPLVPHAILSEDEYLTNCALYGDDSFKAKMGGSAIRKALSQIDIPANIARLEALLLETCNKESQRNLAQRLRLLRAFIENGIKPEWMMLTVLPVLPPGLRPLIPLPGGQFTDDDINYFYEHVVIRNERLKAVLENQLAPLDKIQAAKRELQEAVDALFDNGRNELPVTQYKSSALRKSLTDMLSGKNGRFRQNLLGKRVDFSGRSVIVVGPELKLHQCGLPKQMALVLFEPFIIRRLIERGFAQTIRDAKKWIAQQPPEIWHILEEVMHSRLVLLNRAPTLHRLSIQAFEPVLVEGEAIRLHPLTCSAFNADFDGDQMAVHVPISDVALNETRRLMLATNNILSPASGKPSVTPTQDIVLGCYYLTIEPLGQVPNNLSALPLFGSKNEVFYAHSVNGVKTHDRIRMANPDFGRQTVWGNCANKVILTTPGRVLFSEIWPPELGYYNQPVKKSDLSELIMTCYKHVNHAQVVVMLDKLKEVGFQAATKAGISIGIDDMLIPDEKGPLIAAARERVKTIEGYHQHGIITDNERTNGIPGIWKNCSAQIAKHVETTLKNNQGKDISNPLWLMLNSGARGKLDQVVQITGMRGLMVKANGEIMEKPILSNFREGLNPLEMIISCYGARKGASDTALKTASAGHFTRKLVAVATDVMVTAMDCGTTQGRELVIQRQSEESPGDFVKRLGSLLVGRVAAVNYYATPDSANILVAAGQEFDEIVVEKMASIKVVVVKIRSVLTCACKRGVCALCYGQDLATRKLVKVGEAVGIIAAQSIGEPGTQLTMRTFHTGGVASDKGDITSGLPRVNSIFEAHRPKPAAVFAKIGGIISRGQTAKGDPLLMVTNELGAQVRYKIPADSRELVTEGDTVAPDERLTETISPHEFMDAFGPQKFQERLVEEVQEIYRLQGVDIHPKHIELIARQMVGRVRITEPGDTSFIRGEEVDQADFLEQNELMTSQGGQPAEAKPILLGITQAAQRTKSFLSAASFQNTRKILAEAAVLGKCDQIEGFKERVMVGRLIPSETVK